MYTYAHVNSKIVELIRNMLGENTEIGEMTPFKKLNIDSVHLLKLMVKIEQEFDVYFSEHDLELSKYNCVADFTDAIMLKKGIEK